MLLSWWQSRPGAVKWYYQTRKPVADQLDTFVVVNREGIWKVAHGQNTTVNADAQAFDPIKTNWNGETAR
jgi:hypothetical protein